MISCEALDGNDRCCIARCFSYMCAHRGIVKVLRFSWTKWSYDTTFVSTISEKLLGLRAHEPLSCDSAMFLLPVIQA